MRATEEWIADNDDQAIPVRVKRRVLDSQRPEPNALPICPDCTLPIREGEGADFDHKKALADGGEHRESNLRAIHRRCHVPKTAREATERADRNEHVAKAYGFSQPKGRPMPGTKASGIRKRMNGNVETW